MLEKMGLPPKPSSRGNNWVVDASHCQSCSSQFTFLNRKHHCRRCGGIFCNACTQHRMLLRGQGDSPVRICEPCKKLEEAARFELRYGHKNRVGKGSSKPTSSSRSIDEVLNQVLANDKTESNKDGVGHNEDSTTHGTTSTSNDDSGGDNSEMDNFTPEELRKQAVEEKKQYKILKGEGKSAEALKAFKKSKELERQAAALELQLRKNRKKTLASRSSTEEVKREDSSPEIVTREKSTKGKEKDDLTSELKELGWSDMDIHEIDKKPATVSLEGELLNLIKSNSEKGGKSKESSSSLDKSRVITMKKKALALKREGNLVEAKEELKKAKILEKQIEEQELLGDDDESDDELSALMRSLDNEDKKGISTGLEMDFGFDVNKLADFGGDLGLGGNLDVTDEDFHDSDMAATLKLLGWDENEEEESIESTSVKREELEQEILKLKKEALTEKRSGNTAEAMSLLKKAKILEKELENSDDVNIRARDSNQESEIIRKPDRKPAPKSKIAIQKELLALKKKALALRREGKLEEAENELKKGKILEEQLEEINNPVNIPTQTSEPIVDDFGLSSVLDIGDEDVNLTDQDVNDPTYLAALKNLGWQEEENVESMDTQTYTHTSPVKVTVKKRRSKGEIQRELLGLKRKALALRRQGQDTEADELLASAKTLEEELSELETPKEKPLIEEKPLVDLFEPSIEEKPLIDFSEPLIEEKVKNNGRQQTPLKRTAESNDVSEKRQVVQATVSPDTQKSSVEQEILSHKRKALALKREGKLAEARDELKKAKLLEKSLLQVDEPQNVPEVTHSTVSSTSTVKEGHNSSSSTISEEKGPPQLTTKPMSSSDRLKLQRECLNHKRTAMKLRREGKTDEADAELEIAKKLETQLEEVSLQKPAPATSAGGFADMAGIEDLFDPELLSALQAIGLQDTQAVSTPPPKQEVSSSSSSLSSSKNDVSNQERIQLEAQIKAEKIKALNLKRSGKQAEALVALRQAKQMEKKLDLLPPL